jgi:radical SAM protein with 4Fe4S-binding SPASM domain
VRLEHFEHLQPAAASNLPVEEAAECPFLGREAWVNSKGDFAPCCAPDEQRKSLGSFGNVADPGGLPAIWSSAQYQELVKNYKQRPLCSTCHMRKKPSAAS